MDASEAAQVFRHYGVRDAGSLNARQLRRVRKRLALLYHPDVSPEGDSAHFQRINEAYAVLYAAAPRGYVIFRRYRWSGQSGADS
jgi:curved DNA-binding protein CbpA